VANVRHQVGHPLLAKGQVPVGWKPPNWSAWKNWHMRTTAQDSCMRTGRWRMPRSKMSSQTRA